MLHTYLDSSLLEESVEKKSLALAPLFRNGCVWACSVDGGGAP